MYPLMPVLLLLVLLIFQNGALSQTSGADPLLRVHVPMESEIDAKLLERLRGQTSDLAIELGSFARSNPGGVFGEADALNHCRESHTDVVVWAVPEQPVAPTSWCVGVTTCGDASSLLRQIETQRPALDAAAGAAASGALETAALVLRGALGVLVQGGKLGVTAPPIARVEPLSGASAPSTHITSAPAVASKPSTPGGRTRPSTANGSEPFASSLAATNLLGWGHTWDGTNDVGLPALHVVVALGKEQLQFGIAASLGIGITRRDRYTEITLARHTVAVQWRQRLVRERMWSFSTGLDVGSAFYHRGTRVLQDDAISARPAKLLATPLLSPWASAARRIGPLWIAACAGVDVLPFAPRFVYGRDTEQLTVLELWPISPRLVLSLGVGRP